MDSGESGSLSFIEASRELPFAIRRTYYIYGGKEGEKRGFHAHKTLWQCLVVLQGSLILQLEGPEGSFSYPLSVPNEGVIIPPGYWREMHEMTKDTIVMVLASADYTENDYIRKYEDFNAWQNSASERPVPYLDFTRYVDAFGSKLECAISDVVRSGRYINGPNVKAFEEEFAQFCGVEYAVGVGNGLSALMLILEALNIGSRDEVIVCAAGFVATPLAVSRRGATPVFVESLSNGNIDPDAVEEAITPATKAILLTHLYGTPADMDAVNDIAREHDLHVIEDACQAHGAFYKGRPCGGLGTAAAFSFYPTKNLGCFGDGGGVTTNDPAVAAKIRKLANYGSARKYHHEILGENSRLDEIQATVLRVKLPYLTKWNNRRRILARMYMGRLAEIPEILLPEYEETDEPAWHVYAIRVRGGRRDALRDYLESRGMETNIHYPIALHKQACYAASYANQCFPKAEAQADEVLSLPLDAMHSEQEIARVCNAIRSFFGKDIL
jgi:dTDP-4-amino-4,6-dideoxygalactose transaminase